jgi:uncharacterized protein YqeY
MAEENGDVVVQEDGVEASEQESVAQPDPTETLKKALNSERELRKSAERQLKAILKDSEDKKRASDESNLTEIQKFQKNINELSEQNKNLSLEIESLRRESLQQKTDHEIFLVASSMNFSYPEQAVSLVDRSMIRRDEDSGELTGVKEALEKLLKKYKNMAKPEGSGTPVRDAAYQKHQPSQGQQKKIDPRADLLSSGGYF